MVRRAALALGLMAFAAAAQVGPPNAVLLVAKPGLADARFRDTVVLVTQTRDSQTLGVILNRPLDVKLSQLRPDAPLTNAYSDPLYFGGPVMERTLVVVFKSDAAPHPAVFHLLKGVYLSMHPAVVEPLLAGSDARMRLFAGFSGWAPRQLENEMAREGWYILPATEELLFRKNTSGMWEELLERARNHYGGKHAALYSPS